MTVQVFASCIKQYLGYCTLKGYVYSVQQTDNKYSIVAVQGKYVEVLITYTV